MSLYKVIKEVMLGTNKATIIVEGPSPENVAEAVNTIEQKLKQVTK